MKLLMKLLKSVKGKLYKGGKSEKFWKMYII